MNKTPSNKLGRSKCVLNVCLFVFVLSSMKSGKMIFLQAKEGIQLVKVRTYNNVYRHSQVKRRNALVTTTDFTGSWINLLLLRVKENQLICVSFL